MEKNGGEEEVEGMDATLQGAEYLGVCGGLVLGPEGGGPGKRVEPIGHAGKGQEVVGSINHANGGDDSPSKDSRGGYWDASEEEALQRGHD